MLRGARNLNIFLSMPLSLRSVRLALHPAQTINQRFLKALGKKQLVFLSVSLIFIFPFESDNT